MCPEDEENQRHGKQGDDEVKQRVDCVEPDYYQERGDKRNCRRNVEDRVHLASGKAIDTLIR